MRSAQYFRDVEREGGQGQTAAAAKGYYQAGVDAGEPPGHVVGPGAPDLGLSVGLEMTDDLLDRTFTKTQFPDGSGPIGSKQRNYAGLAESLAKVVEKRGILLPDDLRPAAVRRAVRAEVRQAGKNRVERDIVARIGGIVEPREFTKIKAQAVKRQRKNVPLYDLTFSAPKEWSVLRIAAIMAGDHELARDIAEAWCDDGFNAMLDIGMAEANVTREGYHGKKVAGWSAGRYVDGGGWTLAKYPHFYSREGDPHLHVHGGLLSRTKTADGKWLSIDGNALNRAQPFMAAGGERAAEESLARRTGARFVYDPEIKARRIVGVSSEVTELFSKARASIEARYEEWERRYIADHGQPPNEKRRAAAMHKIAVSNRKPKPAKLETDAESAERWSEELEKTHAKELKGVVTAFNKAAAKRTPQGGADLPAPAIYDTAAIGRQAVLTVGRLRSTFTRYHVMQEVNRLLGELGGMPGADTTAVLRRVAEPALRLPEVTPLRGELLDVPPELRRKDGRSVFSPHDDVLFALTETLTEERWLRTLPLRSGVAPGIDAEDAERAIEGSGLWADPRWADQRMAVKTALSSRRRMECLIGPAGTGKSSTVAGMAKLWSKYLSTPVVGLALSDRAAHELQHQGLTTSTSVAHWFKVQQRAAKNDLFPGEDAFVLRPGSLVVVDEASMASTPDVARICRMVEAAGGKVLLVGDHHQLMAIEGSGCLRMIAEDREVLAAGAVSALTEVARFELREEGDATLGLRVGDATALDFYERNGRIEGGTEAEMIEMACLANLRAYLQRKRSVCIVPTNERAAELSTRMRNELVAVGWVDNEQTVALRDGCLVGKGDRIVCRRPDRTIKDSTGQTLSNRHEFEVLEVRGDGSLVARRDLGRDAHGKDRWTKPLLLPQPYVARHVRLAYAATGQAAQGRTVDEGFLLVDRRSMREYIYVGLTRGRFMNRVFVILHPQEAEALLTPPKDMGVEALDVLREGLQRSGAEQSASEALAEEIEGEHSLARIGPRWADACARLVAGRHAGLLERTVGSEVAAAIAEDPAAQALWAAIHDADASGYDPEAMLPKVVAERELETADSIAEVLHWRIRNHVATNAPDRIAVDAGRPASYVERTPEPDGLATPNLAGNDRIRDFALREAAKADHRLAVLGERLAAQPPVWALHALGPVPECGEALDDWKRRVALPAAYHEQYMPMPRPGEIVTDPIGLAPGPGLAPHRHYDWLLADEALGHPDRTRDVTYLGDEQLRAEIRSWQLLVRTAPDHVEDQLRVARRSLESAELAIVRTQVRLERMKAAGRNEQRQRGEVMTVEVDELRANVGRLDRIHQQRHQWFEVRAEEEQRYYDARAELHRRKPEDPSLRADRTPEEIRAEMTPAERRRYERKLDHERQAPQRQRPQDRASEFHGRVL